MSLGSVSVITDHDISCAAVMSLSYMYTSCDHFLCRYVFGSADLTDANDRAARLDFRLAAACSLSEA